MEIRLDIKPRSIDGILISMRTPTKNFFTLEMKNGTLSCSVDVGKGPIFTSSTRPSPNYLCDGAWHTIKGQFFEVNFSALNLLPLHLLLLHLQLRLLAFIPQPLYPSYPSPFAPHKLYVPSSFPPPPPDNVYPSLHQLPGTPSYLFVTTIPPLFPSFYKSAPAQPISPSFTRLTTVSYDRTACIQVGNLRKKFRE